MQKSGPFRLAATAWLAFCLLACGAAVSGSQKRALSSTDQSFLEDLSRRSFRYFVEQSDPKTGLTLDRARVDGSVPDESHRNVASTAATGFGLTALSIAAERGWMGRDEARERVRASLEFFAERAHHERGWFYHWMHWRTGERMWRSEISSI